MQFTVLSEGGLSMRVFEGVRVVCESLASLKNKPESFYSLTRLDKNKLRYPRNLACTIVDPNKAGKIPMVEAKEVIIEGRVTSPTGHYKGDLYFMADGNYRCTLDESTGTLECKQKEGK